MMTTPEQSTHMQHLIQYNTNRIVNGQHHPVPLNLQLAANPFLKDQQKYHFLIHKLKEYNKRIHSQTATDPYQSAFYERLHSVLCDIVHIDFKESQIERLDETLNWFREQEKLIEQRKDQGEVRYQITKQSRAAMEILKNKEKNNLEDTKEGQDQLPTQAIARETLPFRRGWRTIHKDVEAPAMKLKEYKRKVLNLTPFEEPKETKKHPRVLYPKIPKFQPKFEEPDENPEEPQAPDGENKIIEDKSDGQPTLQGQLPQQQPVDGQQQNTEQQDLGGFGQQPAEPQEQQPIEMEGEDKLAPRLKSFTIEFQDIKRKQYSKPYMYYKGQQSEAERRMQEKYMRIIHKNLNKQKQEMEDVKYLEEWANGKSKIEKQRQKRLENRALNSKSLFSYQQPVNPETLSIQDQIKYGFTTNIRSKPQYSQINLSAYHLPKIANEKDFEKSMKSDRLKSLKKKFGTLLNLTENQDRESAPSLCQFSSRKRGLSEVIREHSKSKERLHQLDEVMRIKQKLSRNRVGIDMKSLSLGLCLPEDQCNPPEAIIPAKDLPSNPFMVQTKKKKKKK